MTIDRITLKELVEKGSDTDLLREMLAFVTGRMMEMEVESLTGAAHGERSDDRQNQRNGYRTRNWETRAGTVPVAIPKPRPASRVRKGARRCHPGSLHPGRLDALGR
jgi:putative transposase